MKINNLKKWTALLLTVSGMATLPLTLIAAVTEGSGTINITAGDSVNRSGTTYSNNAASTVSPISISNTGAFTGTNITITASGTSSSGRFGVSLASSGTLNLTDSVINASLYGVNASSSSVMNLNNTSITTIGGTNGFGLYLSSSSSGTISNVTFAGGTSDGIVSLNNRSTLFVAYSTAVAGSGVSISNAVLIADHFNVSVSGSTAHAFNVYSTGSVTIASSTITGQGNFNGSGQGMVVGLFTNAVFSGSNVQILATGAERSRGVVAMGATLNLHDSEVTSSYIGIMASASGTVNLFNTTLKAAASGIDLDYNNGITVVNITGGRIESDGDALTAGLLIDGRPAIATVNISGGTVITSSGNLFANLSGGGDINLNFDNADTAGAGGIMVSATNSGTTTVSINGGSGIVGDVTNSGSGTLNVNLDNSSLTGSATFASDAVLTMSLDDNSTWNMTGNSTVTNLALNSGGKVVFQNTGGFKTLTVGNLTGSGEFHMNTDLEANTGDLLDITGTSAGSHQVRITNHGNNTAGTEPALLLIHTADGQATFSGTVSVGMFDYSLYQEGNDWYLAASGTNLPPNPPAPQPGDVGKDILTNTPGGQAPGWFDHNDNIGNHLTDLRDSARERRSPGGGGGDKDAALTAASILNSVWIKAYGSQLNISGRVAGVGVRELDYGTDLGADRQWFLDQNNTLILGAFAGYGRTDRETRNNFGGESNTDSFRLGLYGIWLNNSGWFADLIAKGQYADSHLNAYDASHNHTTADFDNWGGGLSIDLGKRFDFQHGWFIDPSVSAAYAHLTGSDYTTAGDNIFTVSASDADVFQFKISVAFGRAIKLTNSGVLQPYLKVGGVEQISTGGKVRASGSEWRPNFDGARAEIGGGIIWQLNADHQLSLDYEASFGDKYDKPWGLTAGYRYQF